MKFVFAYLQSPDGSMKAIYDDGHRLYIIDDERERMYGMWTIPRDEADLPEIVRAGDQPCLKRSQVGRRMPSGHCSRLRNSEGAPVSGERASVAVEASVNQTTTAREVRWVSVWSEVLHRMRR